MPPALLRALIVIAACAGTLALLVGYGYMHDHYGPPWRWPGSPWSWYR